MTHIMMDHEKLELATARVAELEGVVKAAAKVDKAMRDLIAESTGVCGLHLNGDDASWDSLLRGGQ